MPSLLDVGALTEPVDVRGVKVEVGGLSGATFLRLLDRFPEFRKLMSGGAVEADISVLIKQAPDAVGAVIAAACGNAGDKAAEQKAGALSVGEQFDILTVAWGLTFPRGVKTFIEALEGLALQVVGESGWAAATRSPEQSNSLSTTDTPQK